jgi:hypothetical protein
MPREESEMPGNETVQARIARLKQAFDRDGFVVADRDVVKYSVPDSTEKRVGMIARHRTATNYDTGERKRAYYVEGTPFEMGYLMGRLAEPEIDRMTDEFIDNVLWSMLKAVSGQKTKDDETTRGLPLLDVHNTLVRVIHRMIRFRHVKKAVPAALKQELKGIVKGCEAAAVRKNRTTSVTEKELWVLNAGFDCLLSIAYTGEIRSEVPKLSDRDLRMPLACNAFALLNGASRGGPFFGRDLMFATGDVFQDVACHTIYNPIAKGKNPSLPLVSMTAPGFVGSVAAMNSNGIAAGVDMIPGANCASAEPGMNSLFLVRDCIERGTTLDKALNRIIHAQRGVSYDYILAADGGSEPDRACVVEAGASMKRIPFRRYVRNVRKALRDLLPSGSYIAGNPSGNAVNGVMIRWPGDLPNLDRYIRKFNRKLWAHFGKLLRPDAFDERGYINKEFSDENCPETYYFAPVRMKNPDVLIATNHYLHPELRLCGMKPWTNRYARGHMNDVQWRYDELNHQIASALDRGPVPYPRARSLAGFLNPESFPGYFDDNARSRDGKEIVINGSVSLFNLGRRTMESHYGYYGDKWVKTDLTRYIE